MAACGPRENGMKIAPSLSYLICCAERTGSTLLGNALIGTGIAGRPRSYFNRVAHFSPKMRRILGNANDDEKYLDKVIIAATTPNGVFGAKVHWQHFLNLIAKAAGTLQASEATALASVPERLGVHFPDLRYIRLVRRNAVARAISHYRVKKTNRWQLDARWVTDDTGGEGEPGFDFDEIAAFVRLGEVEDARWRQFFREHNISPLELFHEDLVRDLDGTVRRVLGFLGIPAGNVKIPAPNLREQADYRSREWEARYRRICADESGLAAEEEASLRARPISE
jgi:trehalose 2-sulfotransferase